ncbi:ATP-binding cassette domain-containing protein, partial [Mycobacterium tuberculosis]|nr:ATP-binding cassette domain-containing protein [Mycobacterium tuberculosis]
ATDTPAISVEHLTVRFGPFTAVRDFCMTVRAGGSFGLVGESGSGKSTVLRVLSGLNLGDWDGTLAFSGRAAGKKRDRAFFRRVQMVFQ